MEQKSVFDSAVNTIRLEASSIAALENRINEDFIKAVEAIFISTGRLVITGIGKSAIIAQKIVATLNSTGTPAIFLHAADAIHGDIGMVQENDIVMVISKSGNSPEIKVLIPLIRNFGNLIIAMVGERLSYLAKNADLVIDTTVTREACPNNLAPTASTTAQLVMGDALAVCLIEKHGFSAEDFAKFHPGGMLGKKLYLRVHDLHTQNERPAVLESQNLKGVIVEMTRKMLGVTAVVNESNDLLGIITDGDLRRMLERTNDVEEIRARDIMTANPKTIGPDELAVDALDKLRKYGITQLVVTDSNKYMGIVHLHDLLKEGLI
jgi:arabinose-5-phosphate isomerase